MSNIDQFNERIARENDAKKTALLSGKPVVYVDADGCEVTVTPDGSTFFNVSDWW